MNYAEESLRLHGEWKDGYGEEEMAFFQELIRNNAHLILRGERK